jgi:transcriptional regulator with XRE-family HTH domain
MNTTIPHDQAKQAISRRLHALLDARGISVYQMAKDSGLPMNALYRAWRGESIPDAVLLVSIAKFFGVTVEFMLDEN